MQCHTKLVLVVLMVTSGWTLVSCSIVELNDTVLATLPPLYALDDWAQCQRPDDVYCVVDADLIATQPSPMLDLLKAYSKQTLKHYNRTQIHRGVCVTRCGDAGAGWLPAAQRCVNDSVLQYGLEAHVTSVGYCMGPGAPQTSGGGARALAVLCVILLALSMVGTGLHVLCDRCGKFDGNKYLLAFSMKQNWAILTYDRSKPRSDDRMRDTACMEGIRFVGMQGVIFSHVLFMCMYSYTDNPQFIEKMYDSILWRLVLNSPLWLQTFFAMSGFLTAYSVLICSERRPLTVLQAIKSVANRWVRITPLAAFALWFTISWFPLLGSGPQWSWLVEREAEDCAERWWYHLLYVHNHLPLGKLCMGHTWYLAVDMQLHIVGMVVLLALVRWRAAAAPVLAVLVAGSAMAAGSVAYAFQLTPIVTAQSPEALRTLFAGSQLMSLLYLPSWMNLVGYAGGAAAAFALHYCQAKGLKLAQNKCFNIIYHLSLHLGGVVVLCGALFLADAMPHGVPVALYAALDRTLVAVFFSVFLLGCVSRCKSALRSALEWRGFHALGRLSYAAFLVHFIVLRVALGSGTQLNHITGFSLVSLLVTASSLTYAVSLPLCLLVELPSIQLWKALTEAPRPRAPAAAPPPPAPAKPCDLVAHVSCQA